MATPTFETERLRLRPFREDDALELHRILTQHEMLKYFPSPSGPPLDRVQKFVRNQIDQWSTVGYGWWAVELKASGRLIGWNGLQYLPESQETEIGYLLARPLWGQGLATEGARVGVEFAFSVLKIRTLIALAHPDNVASRRVMEKLGMGFDRLAVYFGMQMARYALEGADYKAVPEALRTPIDAKGSEA